MENPSFRLDVWEERETAGQKRPERFRRSKRRIGQNSLTAAAKTASLANVPLSWPAGFRPGCLSGSARIRGAEGEARTEAECGVGGADLRQIEVQTARIESLMPAFKKANLYEQSASVCRNKYCGLTVDHISKMKDLERKVARLRRLLADLS